MGEKGPRGKGHIHCLIHLLFTEEINTILKSIPQGGIVSHFLRFLLPKRQEITSVVKDMDKREILWNKNVLVQP